MNEHMLIRKASDVIVGKEFDFSFSEETEILVLPFNSKEALSKFTSTL